MRQMEMENGIGKGTRRSQRQRGGTDKLTTNWAIASGTKSETEAESKLKLESSGRARTNL